VENLLFTVLGTVLGLLSGMYFEHRKETKGYFFFKSRKKRKYKGEAFDISIRNYDTREGYSLHGDFQRNSDTIWALDYDFSFNGKRLIVTGTAQDGRGTYKVVGRGDLSGSDQSGLAQVTINGAGGDEEGSVLYLLRWNNPDQIAGYWIAKDRTKFAEYAFGALTLRRVSP
jgi:hypothetical protein